MRIRLPLQIHLLGLAAWAAIAFLAAAAAAAAPTASHSSHPLYWGAWIGDQITGEAAPWDMSAATRFEAKVGKGLSLIEFATPFANCESKPCQFYPFPTTPMQAVRDHGSIPMLSWSTAALPNAVRQPDFQLSDIIAGRYDPYIRSFATEAQVWGHPFFLRFNWEMNGNWFPWDEGVNGNRPGQYIKAWRHVHDIFTEVGATNATWVWCPYANTGKVYGGFVHQYPGDRYVDWTCMDGYNFAHNRANPRPWQSFDTIFHGTYRALTTKIAPSKPVMVGEMASTGSPRLKAGWIREMFETLPKSFPRVGGLIWFDQFDRTLRWPIETASQPTNAFRAGLKSKAFLGRSFADLSASPIPMPR